MGERKSAMVICGFASERGSSGGLLSAGERARAVAVDDETLVRIVYYQFAEGEKEKRKDAPQWLE